METGEGAAAAPPAAPESDSALGRLIGVFVSPVKTFTAIAARPTWVLPVAIGAGLSLPLSELILSKMDWRAVVSAQMSKGGRTFTDAQLEQAIEQGRRFAWIWDVFAVAAPVLLTFLIAGVLWIACRAFGWEARFKQSLGITSHAFFPGVLYSIALMAVLWNRTTVNPEKIGDALPTNLGALFGDRVDKITHGLLASIDVFSFWTMALLVIGLSAATGAPRKRVAILVVTLWALYVLGKAGASAVFGS